MREDRLETELRAALRREMLAARPGVTAADLRARIVVRERGRRRTRLGALAVAALVTVALAVPVVATFVVPGPAAPVPGTVEPATVAAIDPASGDLLLSRAWPDGRIEEAAHYPGALDLLREATGGATALPADAATVAGPGGRLAVALPTGDLLVFDGPGDGRASALVTGDGPGGVTWIGWSRDGRLVAVTWTMIRLVEPGTGHVTTRAFPTSVVPYSARLDAVQQLTWTDDDRVVALRSDQANFTSTYGTLDVTADVPTFEPGLPAAVRATTGLEPRIAADGSQPTGWSPDVDPGGDRVGVAAMGSAGGSLPEVSWYVAAAGTRVFDEAWTAGHDGLVVLVAGADAGSGRIVVTEAPGTWRDAVVFTGAAAAPTPGLASTTSAWPRLRGLAPGGRSVAVSIGSSMVVGDLKSGASAVLPAGTLFVGWPQATSVQTAGIPTLPACSEVTPDGAGAVALAAAGTISPASAGVRPVVGTRVDADPWRGTELAATAGADVATGDQLVLALPPGACVVALQGQAVPLTASGNASPLELASRTADTGNPLAGLTGIDAPPAGDWIVRVRLWFQGTPAESILLYRVRVSGG